MKLVLKCVPFLFLVQLTLAGETTPPRDAQADDDGDGVPNQVELHMGMNPDEIDSDGDTLSDGYELEYGRQIANFDAVRGFGALDPTSPDSDGDGWGDAEEVSAMANPANPDSDGDGWGDGDEVAAQGDATAGPDKFMAATDPLDDDSDDDGISDGDEASANTRAELADSDGDGLGDLAEDKLGTNPLNGAFNPAELTIDAKAWGLTPAELRQTDEPLATVIARWARPGLEAPKSAEEPPVLTFRKLPNIPQEILRTADMKTWEKVMDVPAAQGNTPETASYQDPAVATRAFYAVKPK